MPRSPRQTASPSGAVEEIARPSVVSRTMWFSGLVATVSIIFVAGCAQTGGVEAGARDGYDKAYLASRATSEGCAAHPGPSCCQDLSARLKGALANDDMAEVATALDLLAISCPSRRAEAVAALGRKTTAAPTHPEAALVRVSYAVELSGTDRLYWAGAFVDGRRDLLSPVEPGRHELQVEAHVMTTGNLNQDELVVVKATHAFEVLPGKAAEILVVIGREPEARGLPGTPGTFTLGFSKESPFPSDGASVRVGGGFLKKLGQARYPSELTWSGAYVLVKVSVAEDGRVKHVTPIGGVPHPRYVGTVLDLLARAEYEPRLIDGHRVPFWYPLRIAFE